MGLWGGWREEGEGLEWGDNLGAKNPPPTCQLRQSEPSKTTPTGYVWRTVERASVWRLAHIVKVMDKGKHDFIWVYNPVVRIHHTTGYILRVRGRDPRGIWRHLEQKLKKCREQESIP